MSDALIGTLAWALVAWFAICATIVGFLIHRYPFGASARLAAAEARAEAQAKAMEELRGRIGSLESMSAPEFGTAALVAALRPAGGGR